MAQALVHRINKAIFGSIVCAGLVSCSPSNQVAPASSSAQQVGSRPNILLIVVDDLGYSDIGALGGEIETPNMDRLIGDGLMLTNFYAGAACSPTRAMLMSGMDNHRAGVGNMMEHIAPNQKGLSGYEGYLTAMWWHCQSCCETPDIRPTGLANGTWARQKKTPLLREVSNDHSCCLTAVPATLISQG